VPPEGLGVNRDELAGTILEQLPTDDHRGRPIDWMRATCHTSRFYFYGTGAPLTIHNPLWYAVLSDGSELVVYGQMEPESHQEGKRVPKVAVTWIKPDWKSCGFTCRDPFEKVFM
jgi:hypothetical protein